MKVLLQARSVFICILIIIQYASCKKENNSMQYTVPANLKMISSGYAAGASTKVVVYAANSLYVGYNKLYIALYDSVTNMQVTRAQISLSVMASDNYSGPVENPSATPDANGLFDAAAVFTQASNEWSLTLNVQNAVNQKSGNCSNALTVVQNTPALSYSLVTRDDSTHLFVALVQPVTPKLGVNSFELAVYKQVSLMSYAPDSNYQLMMDAEMPSMTGMNSPNNVNPTYSTNGHYVGKVDFIMDGEWQININMLHNGAVADSTHYFNISF